MLQKKSSCFPTPSSQPIQAIVSARRGIGHFTPQFSTDEQRYFLCDEMGDAWPPTDDRFPCGEQKENVMVWMVIDAAGGILPKTMLGILNLIHAKFCRINVYADHSDMPLLQTLLNTLGIPHVVRALPSTIEIVII